MRDWRGSLRIRARNTQTLRCRRLLDTRRGRHRRLDPKEASLAEHRVKLTSRRRDERPWVICSLALVKATPRAVTDMWKRQRALPKGSGALRDHWSLQH